MLDSIEFHFLFQGEVKMKNHAMILRVAVCALSGLALLFLSVAASAMGNSIVTVDQDGTVGQYTSMALDAQGNPVISYYDPSETKLKVVHCFDKNCSSFNAILTPDAASQVGQYSSLVLDHSGNPVVSYYDQANTALKVLHCGNSSCSSGNTIATPDSVGVVGQYTSIAVDSSDRPVVSYYDVTNGKLKILHCGNAACSAGNSLVKPDTGSSNGVQSSVKLNAAGNPVVAYFDFSNSSLKILRCGNANCTAGNAIDTLDSIGDVGRYPSLVLDGSGNPAVSYLDLSNGDLKVLRCGNAACSAGNTIAAADTNGVAGYYSSLALDAAGIPVVSYHNISNGSLKFVHCGNAACTNGNMITSPDASGLYTSLALDASGNPVVSYYNANQGDLKLLHCGSSSCGPNTVAVPDGVSDTGQYTSLKLDAGGKPVVSYWNSSNGDLMLLHCGDATCTAGNSFVSPDTAGITGMDTSLALDAIGNPVVGYYNLSSQIMTVLHCGNANCTGGNTINTPDVFSRRSASLILDAAGLPVIAAAGPADQGLRIVHCGDATCSTNNSAVSPDFPAYPFTADVRGVSLALDASGNPVVSFYRADKAQLKLLHCADPACNGPGNSLVVLDPGAQASEHRSTSLVLDASGNPVLAYLDQAAQALKILRCGNPNCTEGNSIVTAATGPYVGFHPSLKLDAAGNPVVSYGSGANAGLSVLHCGNALCTAGNTTVLADPLGNFAADSSLVLDAAGNPVVSYYSYTGKNLRVLHCGTPTCQ
jgi:hypothetical protein